MRSEQPDKMQLVQEQTASLRVASTDLHLCKGPMPGYKVSRFYTPHVSVYGNCVGVVWYGQCCGIFVRLCVSGSAILVSATVCIICMC